MDIASARQQTLQTYATAGATAAYVARELEVDATRTLSAYSLLEGLNLQGQKVLDVGCGFGRDVHRFNQQGANAYGLDASEPLLAEAAQRFPLEGRLQQGDILTEQQAPFNGNFNLIWCCALLVHVPRQHLPGVLSRMAQWLEPGGHLAIHTKEGEGEKITTNLGQSHPRLMVYYTLPELSDALRAAGFVVEKSYGGHRIHTGDNMLGLVARKEAA